MIESVAIPTVVQGNHDRDHMASQCCSYKNAVTIIHNICHTSKQCRSLPDRDKATYSG